MVMVIGMCIAGCVWLVFGGSSVDEQVAGIWISQKKKSGLCVDARVGRMKQICIPIGGWLVASWRLSSW